MKLDYSQRLNLHALMGGQRGSVDDVRFFWKLQDRIALSEEEKKEVNFRFENVSGNQVAMWDVTPIAFRTKEFEFSNDEIERIRKMINEWQPGFSASDRMWLESLIQQVFTA